MKRKILVFLTLMMLVMFGGCINKEENKLSAGKGIVLEATENGVKVITEKSFTSAEIELEGEISEEDIKISNEYLYIVQKEENSIKVYLAYIGSKTGNVNFNLNNVKKGEINLVKGLVEEDIIEKFGNAKRAGEKLLGDFNASKEVDLQDFNLFKQNFGKQSATYDIGPASKGSGDWAGIYCYLNGDGKVGLEDLTVFASNFGKKEPNGTVIVDVTSVNLSVSKTALKVGETATATATVNPSNATNKTLNWTVSNTAVLTISASSDTAVIAAKAEGTSTVTITSNNGKTATLTITVTKDEVKGIELHAKFTHLWAWNKNGAGAVNEFTTWPGQAMEAETNGWYKWYFADAKTIDVIFSNNSGGQTATLSIAEEGKYWYDGTKFLPANPDVDTEAPKVTVTPKAKKQEVTTLYYEESTLQVNLDVTDNQDATPKAYYTTNGTTPTVSNTQYTGAAIPVTDNMTLKVFAIDKDSNSSVTTFTFKLNQDATAPTITANPDAGRYDKGTVVNVKLTAKDNKDTAPKIYYTIDGTTPTENFNYFYNGETITITEKTTIKTLVVDASGNKTTKDFSYYFTGDINITRFDPRQETIYFLLTSRWFDGDTANSIGDEWCSYTPERALDPNSGFTGPEDVSWRGDFKGLVERMDYIKALGFTAIWITPIVQNRSPLSYHGYHGWDFTKEDSRLVSPGYDFQRVVDEAHARDMKICLDIVLNHSGRYGIKDHAEVKYATDPALYPNPDEWAGWTYDEDRYQQKLSQEFPNGWEFDGLTSPGKLAGKDMPPYTRFGDIRGFTSEDLAKYPYLHDKAANGFMKFQWPTTESYVLTLDNHPGADLSYEEYRNRPNQWLRGYMNGFNDSGMFDKYPECNLRTIHEDCPELNTESTEVQEYLLNAYYRYIDMGVDMFRVDTVMHVDKVTLNEMYWPQLLDRAEKAKAARGGADFFMFGEVANFVGSLTDKPAQLRQTNYTWDNSINDGFSSNNHYLNGNNYRTTDYSKKAPKATSPYHVSVIDLVSHNAFINSPQAGYNTSLGTDSQYNDATFLTWYADSHDYGPNKSTVRYQGDFAALWSMLFTFRGIPIVYYGSEIKFAQGKHMDWPGGGASGTEKSLELTGRSYFGPHLQGSVTATGFGEYTASGEVANTLSHELAQHLIGLNKIRHAIPALQMGQYSLEGHQGGGWAGYKRRYTGTNKLTGEAMDSYVVVGVGEGVHSWTGVLDGTYVDAVTGKEVTANGGNLSFTVSNGGDAGLGVYVLKGLATPAPGKIDQPSPFLK